MLFDIKPLSIQDITSIITCITVVLSAYYAFTQYKATRLSDSENALIKTYEFLQSRDFIIARRYIFKHLANKPFENWTDEDIDNAETVCRNYDTAFLINEQQGYENNLRKISVKWNHSIINSYKICKPLILNYKSSRGGGFWNHFDKLHALAGKVKTDNTDLIA